MVRKSDRIVQAPLKETAERVDGPLSSVYILAVLPGSMIFERLRKSTQRTNWKPMYEDFSLANHEAIPMTHPTVTVSVVLQRVGLCLLAAVLLMETGCVSRRIYERTKAETAEHTQAFESVREDVKALDQQIAELHAANHREDAAVSDLRMAIQQEEDQLPIMRQRSEERLSSLKVQVATLMNQSWHLARKIADMRQERASLQTLVAQYKEEMEATPSPLLAAADLNQPAMAPATVTDASVSSAPLGESELTQIAQAAPAASGLTPAKPAVSSSPVNLEPPTTTTSWIGVIANWFSMIWNWLFG